MGVQGADWLERNEREREEDPDLAIRLLKIQKGSTVADVGAGSGYITLKLARAVGATGKVYANDIQPGMLESAAEEHHEGQSDEHRPRARYA